MVWAAISLTSLGPLLVLDGHVHPMVQTLYPEDDAVYQDDNAPIHTARLVTVA